jgi:hypothetical protein
LPVGGFDRQKRPTEIKRRFNLILTLALALHHGHRGCTTNGAPG